MAASGGLGDGTTGPGDCGAFAPCRAARVGLARAILRGMADGRARDDELAATVEALRARVEALEADADDGEDEVEWLTPWRGFLLGAGLGFLFG